MLIRILLQSQQWPLYWTLIILPFHLSRRQCCCSQHPRRPLKQNKRLFFICRNHYNSDVTSLAAAAFRTADDCKNRPADCRQSVYSDIYEKNCSFNGIILFCRKSETLNIDELILQMIKKIIGIYFATYILIQDSALTTINNYVKIRRKCFVLQWLYFYIYAQICIHLETVTH